MSYKKIPGTRDILPEESGLWQNIEELSREVFCLYGYQEVRTPLIEDESLFNRSLGNTSEIVQKQMFLIPHQDQTYCLRPEGTASVVRAFIENNLDKETGFSKLFYLGPMFRMERPQKGRLRQFHHIGCEAIGSLSADLDVETISLADSLLKCLNINGYTIKINNLGCAKDKKSLIDALHKALKGQLPHLCPDCQRRYETNALRILDCKNEECRSIVSKLRIHDEYLCRDCAQHFIRVKEGLDLLKIGYEIVPHLVRGLDYYTRTVFEVTHPDLGAQDALGAGGRYDNLVKELGGPDVGAIGFALGVERLLLACKMPRPQAIRRSFAYLITLGQAAEKEGMRLIDDLRKSGIACDTDYENRSLKGAMRRADDLKAGFVLILGDDELKKGIVTLKNMSSGEQKEIRPEDLKKELKC
ncbi:MAG: histidine--tRNA ligase [Candidatus Omnitrophica bacterium]|nr:histidine--tRNA ligase [Candidatus Omnitrophota bacterium]